MVHYYFIFMTSWAFAPICELTFRGSFIIHDKGSFGQLKPDFYKYSLVQKY